MVQRKLEAANPTDQYRIRNEYIKSYGRHI